MEESVTSDNEEFDTYKDETTSFVWERYFTELTNFRANNSGPVKVPHNKQHKGLARWLERQGTNQCTTAKQWERLSKLGYSLDGPKKGRSTTRCDSIWDAHFEKLKEYKATYGNCNVPSTYDVSPKLANWVASQRRAFGRGDIKQDCFRRLRRLDFIFRLVQRPCGVSSVGKNEAKWNANYGKLKELIEIHGSCIVRHVVKENRCMYNWITRQRQLYKKDGGLTEQRIEKLKKLGFPWNICKGN